MQKRIDWRDEAGSMQPYRGWAPGCDHAICNDPSNRTMPRVLEVSFGRSSSHLNVQGDNRPADVGRRGRKSIDGVDKQVTMFSFAKL